MGFCGWLALLMALAPADLLPNGDFESGGRRSVGGWQQHVPRGEYRFEISPTAHAGRRSLSIVATPTQTGDGWARWYTTDLYLQAGAKYHLAAWVRTSGDAVAQVWLPGGAAGFQANSSAGEWTRLEGEFAVTTTGRHGLYLQSLRSGTVWFDDLSLTVRSPAPAVAGDAVPTDGASLLAVVVPDAAGPHHGYLAAEAQRILGAITGHRPAVVAASAVSGPGRRVWIGVTPPYRSYARDLARVGPEGIVLDVSPTAVVCLGNTPRGVYYAVQEWFRQLGCRWAWPGPLGEVLPPSGPLTLPPRRVVHRPSFDLRGGHIIQVHHQPPDWEARHIDTEAWVDWAARNQMNRLKASYCPTWDYGAIRGGGSDEMAGHSLYAIVPPEELFASHPEYYPLVAGQRTAKHSSGRAAELCVSAPGLAERVAEAIVDYFDSHPNARRYCVNAEDEPSFWCECAACRALDPVPQVWTPQQAGTYYLTDRWLTFINRVAALVEPRYPDRYVSTFAYGSTRELPRRVKPRRNVMVELTWWDQCFKHTCADRACPINAQGLRRLDGWRRLAPLALYRYLDYHHLEMPGPYFAAEADLLRTAHARGVRFLSDEWDTTFTASALLLNLRARLEWDVTTNVEAFIDDWCARVYGPAGPAMAAWYRHLQRAVQTAPAAHVSFNDLTKWTPSVVREGHRLLDTALLAAADDDGRARIERQRCALWFAQLDQLTAAERYEEAAPLQDQLADLLRRRQIAPILGYYGRLGLDYRPPLAALRARRLLRLPDTWSFRRDPADQGLRERWFELPPDAAWQPITILKCWEEQGHGGYDGVAWYSVEVDLPTHSAQRLWLLCEAVDETFDLWIDGLPAGGSHGDPGLLWDKPVAVDLTAKLPPGRHRLTFRVHDSGYAGGIWKPVWVTGE
ncbi:MAG: DUF4838 domain-containing protein [Fimbriimonadaceae bacterium]|nr:DUF4838 domain-containing protein [Fimbriimonadaceae bacterium]